LQFGDNVVGCCWGYVLEDGVYVWDGVWCEFVDMAGYGYGYTVQCLYVYAFV